MVKILVFGASGKTGLQVVQQALERGLDVTAIVRKPFDFKLKHKNLKVRKGDVLDPESFEKELIGQDVVISCLGMGSSRTFTNVYSKGIENITSIMNRYNIKRIICISAGALYTNKEMGIAIRIVAKVFLQRIFRKSYADMGLMEKILQKSLLNWTIIRPPMLNNKEFTGKYRIAIQSHLKHPFSISRSDLAHYVLNCLENFDTIHSIVEIAY